MYRTEQAHWWYLGMQSVTNALLDRFVAGGAPRILDAGCGTGAGMLFLRHRGQVTGCDLSPLALAYCRRRGLERISRAGVSRLPFPAECFDLVTSFDVLYESGVGNPATALEEFARVLRPNGLILLRLPACDWLRGRHDRAVHTARRFDARTISRLLRGSGLQVLHVTYANTLLFPVAAALRLAERVFPPAPGSSDLSLGAGFFNSLLRSILACEAPFVAGPGLPFGLSVIAVARKPG